MNTSSKLRGLLTGLVPRTAKGKTRGNVKRLPQEIIDYILDFLWYDRKSLRSCAVVCSSWRATCQAHLFHKLQLGWDSGSFTRKVTKLEAHHALAGYVRYIYLRGHRTYGEAIFVTAWIPEALSTLSSRSPPFPYLTHLHLQLTRLHDALPFPHLTRLTLRDCHLGTLRGFDACVRAAPRLCALDVCSCYWADTTLPDDHAPPLALQLLAVDRITAMHIHSWLARTQSLGTIRTLIAEPYAEGETSERTFHDFLPDPTRLERLQLLCDDNITLSPAASVDLSRYTRLTHLSVKLGRDWAATLAPLFALPALRVLFIEYDDYNVPWEPLAEALLDHIADTDALAKESEDRDGEHTNRAPYRTVHLIQHEVLMSSVSSDLRVPPAREYVNHRRTRSTLGRGVLWVRTPQDPQLSLLLDSVF